MEEATSGEASPKRLTIVITGLRAHPLLYALQQRGYLADSDWTAFHYGYASIIGAWLPWARRRRIHTLSDHLDRMWRRHPDRQIVLIGEGWGATIAREAYLLGRTRRLGSWADSVSRIVILTSRRSAPWFKRWSGSSVYRYNVEIDWLNHFGRDDPESRSILIEAFPGATPGAVTQGAVAVDLDPPSWAGAQVDPLNPLPRLQSALQERPTPQPTSYAHRSTPPQVRNVVFVLHGIRANNLSWVEDAKKLILTRDPHAKVIANGYGWLSALEFAIPWVRRRSLPWFINQYTLALRDHPEAAFSFIGHSNGTYILGLGLQLIRGIRFSRVALTGSVLPRDYDWDGRAAFQQVAALRNDRANRDWPVAFLCSALRGLGMKDIGTGGFDGFESVSLRSHDEVFWHDGGHGAAVDDPNSLESLVDFVLTGQYNRPAVVTRVPSRYAAVSARLPALTAVIAISVLAVVAWMLLPVLVTIHLPPGVVLTAALTLALLVFLWLL